VQDQKKLAYIIQEFINPEEWPTLRGIIANWEDQTLCIKFFFSEEVTDQLRENASLFASETIAQYADGFLMEDYIYLDRSRPLPSSSFWIYQNLNLSQK